jgi:hypothetical protein
MPKLFDLFAGAGSGAIIAGSLITPGDNGENLYYAEHSMDMFKNEGPNIYVEHEISFWIQLATNTGFAILFGFLIRSCFRCKFKTDPHFKKKLQNLQGVVDAIQSDEGVGLTEEAKEDYLEQLRDAFNERDPELRKVMISLKSLLSKSMT